MKYFNLHTHKATQNPNRIELVNQYPNEFENSFPYYSIGIHPWYIVEERVTSDLEIIEQQLQDPNCLALGECGLDKRIAIELEMQQFIFEQQLHLAQKYNKPVVIHCVAAYQEVIASSKKLKISIPLLIHGFSKNETVAQSLLNNGFYLSFGKYLVQNPALASVFQNVPDHQFFLETDTIENGIEEVYALAAQYKNTTVEAIQQQINANIKRVFGLQLD